MSQKLQKVDEQTRAQVAEFLPEAVEKTLRSYRKFAGDGGHEGPKEFKSHHEACKMALSHLQLLLKLAEWAGLPSDDEGGRQETLARLIESAQSELAESGY